MKIEFAHGEKIEYYTGMILLISAFLFPFILAVLLCR